jgi:hypothetical protein
MDGSRDFSGVAVQRPAVLKANGSTVRDARIVTTCSCYLQVRADFIWDVRPHDGKLLAMQLSTSSLLNKSKSDKRPKQVVV